MAEAVPVQNHGVVSASYRLVQHAITAATMNLAKEYEVVYEKSTSDSASQISVLISCYKYGKEATEALTSLLTQTEPEIDVVVIDDNSPDNSVAILQNWFARNGAEKKLANIKFIRHLTNQGASQARNSALFLVETPYTFILDADNQLYPRALSKLREAVELSGCAMSYSLIERHGIESRIVNNSVWNAERFSYGNYIDSMSLIRTDILKELGGYRQMPSNYGWEDYDLWCSFVDRGLRGCHVPQILCRYRVHGGSISQTTAKAYTERHLDEVRGDFEARHRMPFYLGHHGISGGLF